MDYRDFYLSIPLSIYHSGLSLTIQFFYGKLGEFSAGIDKGGAGMIDILKIVLALLLIIVFYSIGLVVFFRKISKEEDKDDKE